MISERKFAQIYQGMNSLAQKVYESVPIQAPWSTQFIMSEMQRRGSSTRDMYVVEGCLARLVDAGLVRRVAPNVFIRVPLREVKTPETIVIKSKEEKLKVQKTESRSPVEVISGLSQALRKLADEMDTAALEIEESISKKNSEVQKLQQLKTLLKDLA